MGLLYGGVALFGMGSRWGVLSPGCSPPACACFALCNRGALCHTPRGPARCSPAPGLWDVPGGLACRVPSSSELPARAPGVLCVSGKSVTPADILKWAPVPTTMSSTFGLIMQDQISAGLILGGRANPLSSSPDLPRAFFFCLGRLHARQHPHVCVVLAASRPT